MQHKVKGSRHNRRLIQNNNLIWALSGVVTDIQLCRTTRIHLSPLFLSLFRLSQLRHGHVALYNRAQLVSHWSSTPIAVSSEQSNLDGEIVYFM